MYFERRKTPNRYACSADVRKTKALCSFSRICRLVTERNRLARRIPRDDGVQCTRTKRAKTSQRWIFSTRGRLRRLRRLRRLGRLRRLNVDSTYIHD